MASNVQVKEEMFFINIHKYEELNFPAFFLKELIEYEYPGFESFVRSEEFNALVYELDLRKYHERMNRAMHPNKEELKSDTKDNSNSTSAIEPHLKTFNQSRQQRLRYLYSELLILISENTKFSFAWACSDYTMTVGLTWKHRTLLLQELLHNPTRSFDDIIKSTYSNDFRQADYPTTAEQFFTYFFTEEITGRIKALRANSTIEKINKNLLALTKHLERQDELPLYLENRHQSFLKDFGMLLNLEGIPEINSLEDNMEKLACTWSSLLPFNELRGLLIRTKSQGWESQYGIHFDSDPKQTPKWKNNIVSHLEDCFAKHIAKISTQPDFLSSYRSVDSARDIDTFFLSDAPLLTTEDRIEKHLEGNLFSDSFMKNCLLAYFNPNTNHENFEGNMKLRMNADGYYSFLSMKAAKSILNNTIDKYRDEILSKFEELSDLEVKKWFKTKLLGDKITRHLQLD